VCVCVCVYVNRRKALLRHNHMLLVCNKTLHTYIVRIDHLNFAMVQYYIDTLVSSAVIRLRLS
jgi:hypothetical protein